MDAIAKDFLRDEDQRRREQLIHAGHDVLQTHDLRDSETAASGFMERRHVDFLIGEFDKHGEEMSELLRFNQAQMGEMRLKLESIVKENEKLHQQLKESLETQLDSLPTDAALASEAFTEQELIKNLQEQLQLANQEKEHALELWQMVAQEMDRLQQQYQEHMTNARIHVAEREQQKDEIVKFQQLSKKLHGDREKVELMNQHFLHTVNEQQKENDQLTKQLRQEKVDLKVATLKVEELTKLLETVEDQANKREEEVLAARGKEEASDKRVQQLLTAVTQLETRLKAVTQDSEQIKAERTQLEKHIGELQAKCSEMEQEKYEAVSRVRDSMQIVEEANILKSQALLREKQKQEEIEKMKEVIAKIIQEAATRTRKEVENARKLSNVQISRLTDDISALQTECGEKQSLIERLLREKRAAEEELEKVYREGRVNEKDYRKLEELQQRCLIAERNKDDLQISLRGAQKKIKQLELNTEEELSRCHETIQKLNEILESERKESSDVSEERLKLVQVNEQLRKEVEEWRKTAIEAQQKVKFQISTMTHEFSVKEQGYEVQLQEMEDSCRKSMQELMRLLTAQQKTSYKWKEETNNLTKSTENRLRKLRSELKEEKRQKQDLLSQLGGCHEKNVELEKMVVELQEKSNRLQKRLDHAEEQAVEASKQLNLVVSQRRKAAHKLDLGHL
ncbi:sodium channel and clathrin linker 1 [Hyperolius riggenbachi]|uniref:sodium channel and clathrin linker 1 n=1 Tax=Hyperolius riggenbachi TaxID=752182 RepID=UPI0035A34FC1